MAIERKVQPRELEIIDDNEEEKGKRMENEKGIQALARFVKYCEDEAAGLNLSFVAYCLSIANDALAEEFNGTHPLTQPN